MNAPITISTPGRICLFGEHQDYLGLPVIAAAISLRVRVSGRVKDGGQIYIDLPDVGQEIKFGISNERLAYEKPRDYFRSAYNVLLGKGLRFSNGLECHVRGNIPINSGTSSSSALVVSWLHFLSFMADNPRTFSPTELAQMAFEAEVTEFNEPGGMMDHLATAVGKIGYFEFEPALSSEVLGANLGSFVLADSLEPKDTIGVLKRAKYGRLEIIDRIKKVHPQFSLADTSESQLPDLSPRLNPEALHLLTETIRNRDILRQALHLFRTNAMTDAQLGDLLTQHHQILRDALGVSTPKIEKMMHAALDAGALGGKINGSGGGGCMFVYAPHNAQHVANAIAKTGAKCYIVEITNGTINQT